MADVARGAIADRPWGMTLAAIRHRRHSGQLTVSTDGKDYTVAVEDGLVIAATSPSHADTVLRIAVTLELVPPGLATHLSKQIAASPERDEVEVIAQAIGLTDDQVATLRRSVVARRSARTFAIDLGEFVIEDRSTLPHSGISVDLLAVIYLGALTRLSDRRLADELGAFGSQFELTDDADFAAVGFTDAEQPLLDALRTPASLADLEARFVTLGTRTIHAVVYTLVACGAAVGSSRADLAVARTITPAQANTARVPVRPRAPTAPPEAMARPIMVRGMANGTTPPHVVVQPRTLTPPPRALTQPRRTITPPFTPRSIDRMAMGTTPPHQTEPAAPFIADNTDTAGIAFRAGLVALRAEDLVTAVAQLARAVELAPDILEYPTMLAWARFCASADKAVAVVEARKILGAIIAHAEKPEQARLYLGRVERMVGRDREALELFRAVLHAQPRHAEAAAEVRVIEARLAPPRRPVQRPKP